MDESWKKIFGLNPKQKTWSESSRPAKKKHVCFLLVNVEIAVHVNHWSQKHKVLFSIWGVPKIGVYTPKSSIYRWFFHYKPTIWGTSFMEIPISFQWLSFNATLTPVAND
jgi:hypothetical protein